MKNLLVATINHNDEDRRIKIVCRKDDEGYYRWYDDETDTESGCHKANSLEQAKEYALACWGSDAWSLKASWR